MKRLLKIAAATVLALVGLGAFLYASNSTPVVAAVSAGEAAHPTKPFVVKLHAQWCPVCMLTKGVWAKVEEAYAGRANLVVFDFTNEEKTQASRAEARRLGLEAFLDEYAGASGLVVVLDGPTRAKRTELAGDRDFVVYQAAIDEALRAVKR